MPEVTCTCGQKFTAAKANARYCSDKCRKRTKRSGADAVAAPSTDAPADEPKLGPITLAALKELDEARRLDTALGQTALALAHRLDHGMMETGSAYASLSKEFEAKMVAATRGASKATGPRLQPTSTPRRERLLKAVGDGSDS